MRYEILVRMAILVLAAYGVIMIYCALLAAVNSLLSGT